MSPYQALPASRPRRRPPVLLLLIGLAVGLVAATTVATPASARTSVQADDPLCYADAYSQLPGPVNPVASTWTRTGARTNGSYTYRYWMVQEVAGSTLYYSRSLVATCSGRTLVTTATLPATDAFGTVHCTSSVDIQPPTGNVVERYVGQRATYERGFFSTFTYRYWHREYFSYITLTWRYDSSYLVRC